MDIPGDKSKYLDLSIIPTCFITVFIIILCFHAYRRADEEIRSPFVNKRELCTERGTVSFSSIIFRFLISNYVLFSLFGTLHGWN